MGVGEMTERMTDERLAELIQMDCQFLPFWPSEIIAALKAEREAAKLSHDMFIGAMADIKSMEREIEAAEAEVKRLRDLITETVESKCEHDPAEQETAVFADRLCPLCMEAKLVKTSTKLHDLLTLDIPELQLSLKEADDKLEAVRGLVEKWQKSANSVIRSEWDEGWQRAEKNCADELEALLK